MPSADSETASEDADDHSDARLATLQQTLEWNCNEANNYHCKIVTERDVDSQSPYLRIWPETNARGEYVKTSGWDSVLRKVFAFEREHDDVYVTGISPDESIIVRERPLENARK